MKACHFVIVTVLTTLLWLTTGIALAQEPSIQFSAHPAEKYKVSSFTWKGHFGGRKEEPHNIYVLMSNGGFLAPTSKNYEDLINVWLAKHPSADVIVVYTLDGALTDFPESKSKWVWVIDGEENLNIHLVRMGGCQASTMFLDKGDKAHVTKGEYESFIKKIIEAESLAKKEHLGIWSEKN